MDPDLAVFFIGVLVGALGATTTGVLLYITHRSKKRRRK